MIHHFGGYFLLWLAVFAISRAVQDIGDEIKRVKLRRAILDVFD